MSGVCFWGKGCGESNFRRGDYKYSVKALEVRQRIKEPRASRHRLNSNLCYPVTTMATLLSSALAAGLLVSSVHAKPLDLSIPGGVIPSIPGVTEPLASLAPPLPILQVPTPPLDSPPFTPSTIKPKKIGYFWTGAGDNEHKDFLVTASLDDVSNMTLHLSYRKSVDLHYSRTPSVPSLTSPMSRPAATRLTISLRPLMGRR